MKYEYEMEGKHKKYSLPIMVWLFII